MFGFIKRIRDRKKKKAISEETETLERATYGYYEMLFICCEKAAIETAEYICKVYSHNPNGKQDYAYRKRGKYDNSHRYT